MEFQLIQKTVFIPQEQVLDASESSIWGLNSPREKNPLNINPKELQ